MELTNDKKLIAEFMGAEGDYLPFDEDWNWLMAAVEECLTTGDRQHFAINDALLTCNIQEVYKAVVEFIKWYNDGKQ